MHWFLRGSWPVGPPCLELRHDDALSSCQSRFESLFQSLSSPEAILVLDVHHVLFDSSSVILRSSLQRLVCSSITLPYFFSRVSPAIINNVRHLVDLGKYLLYSWGHCVHVVGNFLLSVSPLVRLVCEVLWDHALAGPLALTVVCSG